MLGNAGNVAPLAEIPTPVPTVGPLTAAEAPVEAPVEPSPLPEMETPVTPPGQFWGLQFSVLLDEG